VARLLQRRTSWRNRLVAALTIAGVVAGCSWQRVYERKVLSEARQTVPPLAEERAQFAAPPSHIPPRDGFIAQTPARDPEDERATFTVPDGFEVPLVASEPDIAKPMQLAFNHRGQLLVSTSTEYPLGAPEGDVPSDRVMLIDIDAETGRATRVTTFAEGFNICSGVEALPGNRVVLGHAPDILLLHDKDADGVADSQEVLYTGFARDDTHELPNSFMWGFDGWLYGLQGHVNVSPVKDRDGDITEIRHGNTYRMRPDGRGIEVWARGMSNPWGLTYGQGHDLYGADCESRPLWQLVRSLPYQGFLQPEDPLGFAPNVTTDPHGASGFAGLVYYDDVAFPAEYRGCLYLGNPITGRIHRDRPDIVGATRPMLRQPDLLTSTDPWFRPVDVELGPDGALYIADWYNPIIAHVEVELDHPKRDKTRGRIWRIVYRGDDAEARGPMDTNLSAAGTRVLLDTLGHPQNRVRRRVAAELRARYPEDAKAACRRFLANDPVDSVRRIESVWLLHTLVALTFEDVKRLVDDPNPHVRQAAVRIVGMPRDDIRALAQTAYDTGVRNEDIRELVDTPDVFWEDFDRTVELGLALDDPEPVVAREAALGLASFPSPASLHQLLGVRTEVPEEDRMLRYALRFAAREHLRDNTVLEEVAEDDLERKEPGEVARLIVRTPTVAAARVTARYLDAGKFDGEEAHQAIAHVFAYADTALLTEMLARADSVVGDENRVRAYARAVHRSIARIQSRDIDPVPAMRTWVTALAASTETESRHLAVEVAADFAIAEAAGPAREALPDSAAPDRIRERAARLLLALDRGAASEAVLAIVGDPSESGHIRGVMAREYAKTVQSKPKLDTLLTALEGAPARSYAGAVESLALQRPGADLMLAAVDAGELSVAHINNHVTRWRIEFTHGDADLNTRYAALTEGAYSSETEGPLRALAGRLRERFHSETGHDKRRGQEVFENNCMQCHRVGGVGTLFGPNLDGVGNRGVERMLQDILLPNLDMDPAFSVVAVETDDFESAQGVVLEEDGATLTLGDSTGAARTFAKSAIVERETIPLSIMPADFGNTLDEDAILDLVAFLVSPPAEIVPVSDRGRFYVERAQEQR